MDNTVLDGDNGELLEYSYLISLPQFQKLWGMSYGNELGLFFQGMPGGVNKMNTIVFIYRQTT